MIQRAHENRSFKALFATLLLASSVAGAQGQTAERILRDHIKAIGGDKALARISSSYLEGRVSNPVTGQTGTFIRQTKAPDRITSEVILSGVHTVEAFNGKSAWKLDSGGGLRTLTGIDAARLEATALYRNNHFLGAKRDKTRIRLAGTDHVGNRPAFVLEIISRAGITRKVFFDAQHFLILEEEQADEGTANQIFFRDYRSVDGVLEPFDMEMRHGAQTLEISVTEVTHNHRLADSVFDFPKMSEGQLPDIAALLVSVARNQKKIDEILESYTYNDTETQTKIDKDGRTLEKSEKVYEVFHLGGRSVRKLVKKDGRVLSAAEQEQEAARVDKAVREYQKRRAQEGGPEGRVGQQDTAEGEEPDPHKQKEHVGVSTFLRVSQFTNARREKFRGQEVIVFDFEPKLGYKPRDLAEKILQSLVGVVWIDECARQVARLEAHLSNSVKVIGGFATLQRGSAVVFEQTMVNNEVWLPSYAEIHLSAKAFFVLGLNPNIISRFSDYKKFRVESVVKTGSL